jgi:hypothetical protein
VPCPRCERFNAITYTVPLHLVPPGVRPWQHLCADCFREELNAEPSDDLTMHPTRHGRRGRRRDPIVGEVHTGAVQDISIVTSRTPIVYRAEGSNTVYLTFEGLRESRTIADKHTRVRIALPAQQAVHLWQQLANDAPVGPEGQLTDPKRWTTPQ